MQIMVIKYGPDSDGKIRNYFAIPPKVDAMVISDNEILDSGLPEYTEQINGEQFALRVELGTFKLKFSLLQTTLSVNQGKNIYDFFTSNPDYLFICAVLTDEKEFAGKVDMGQLEIDKNPGGYTVTIGCKCLEDELIDHLKSRISIGYTPGTPLFDNFIGDQSPFWRVLPWGSNYPVLPDHVHVINNIQISEKVGVPVYFNVNLYSKLVGYGLPGTYGYNITVWRTILDLMKGLGFTWKLKYRNWASPFFHFDMIFFWRSTGLDETFSEFNVLEDGYWEGVADYEETNKNLIVIYSFQPLPGIYKSALFLTANWSKCLYPVEYFGFESWRISKGFQNKPDDENWYNAYPPGNPPMISRTDETTVIELEGALQEQIKAGSPIQISVTRLLQTGEGDYKGLPRIIEKTAFRELEYLLKGLRRILRLDIHFTDAAKLEIYNRVTYEGRNYIISRIRNLNFIKKKCEIELVEYVPI